MSFLFFHVAHHTLLFHEARMDEDSSHHTNTLDAGNGDIPTAKKRVAYRLKRMEGAFYAFRVFAFEGSEIRVLKREEDGKLVFVVIDMSAVVGNAPSLAVASLDNEDKGLASYSSLGGLQDLVVTTEVGFYCLAVRSQYAMTPGTMQYRFRRWATGEVLQEMHRTARQAAYEKSLRQRDFDHMLSLEEWYRIRRSTL